MLPDFQTGVAEFTKTHPLEHILPHTLKRTPAVRFFCVRRFDVRLIFNIIFL